MVILLLALIIVLIVSLLLHFHRSKLYFIQQLNEMKTVNSNIVSDFLVQSQALARIHDEFGLSITNSYYLGTKWSIYPDALIMVLEHIEKSKPDVIVEFGCGSSTFYIGALLRSMGSGKLISLEDNKEYYSNIKTTLINEGLEKQVSLYHCPLIKTEIDSFFDGYWYDTSKIEFSKKIDVMLVDGPYGHSHKIGRYPAFPKLVKHMSDNCTIFLDDGKRKGEKEISALWLKSNKSIQVQYIDTYRGLYKFILNGIYNNSGLQ